jgi:hyperosmotically inducible periplasmic protein
MKTILRALGIWLAVGVLGAAVAAETSSAARYDSTIGPRVAKQLAAKKEFRDVKASVEDGIVTLSGDVDLYQQKLDAAKKVRKIADVQGVRNLIAVNGNVPDDQLAIALDRKLYYDRLAQDNVFNYVTASVENGAVTLSGETRNEVDRDSALSIVDHTAGVKDVIDNVKVAPASIFDDQVRISAFRAIYRDPVLSRYAIDPGKPIRIVVDNGHLSLYGTVASRMDKQVAGIRASQVFGAFTVQNNLQVEKKS